MQEYLLLLADKRQRVVSQLPGKTGLASYALFGELEVANANQRARCAGLLSVLWDS